MLRVVRDEALRHNVTRVTEITLRVGLFSAVEEETLRACFELLAEGGIAEGAALRVEIEPLPAHCAACGHEFELSDRRRFVCPRCMNAEINFNGVHGCTIQSISAECAAENEEEPA